MPCDEEELKTHFKALGFSSFAESSFLSVPVAQLKTFSDLADSYLLNCPHVFKHSSTVGFLKDSKFDAVFADPIMPCAVILAKYLGLPSIYLFRGFPGIL